MAGLSCEELSFFFSFIPREKYLVLEAVGIAQTPCLLIRAWSYLVKGYSQLYKVGNLYNIMVIYYVFKKKTFYAPKKPKICFVLLDLVLVDMHFSLYQIT